MKQNETKVLSVHKDRMFDRTNDSGMGLKINLTVKELPKHWAKGGVEGRTPYWLGFYPINPSPSSPNIAVLWTKSKVNH